MYSFILDLFFYIILFGISSTAVQLYKYKYLPVNMGAHVLDKRSEWWLTLATFSEQNIFGTIVIFTFEKLALLCAVCLIY